MLVKRLMNVWLNDRLTGLCPNQNEPSHESPGQLSKRLARAADNAFRPSGPGPFTLRQKVDLQTL